MYLSRIRYYLYYRLQSATESVEVLAFWHASRGSLPSCRASVIDSLQVLVKNRSLPEIK